MPQFTLVNAPVEVCDELNTQIVPLPFVDRGDYVLLHPDVDDDPDVPLVVPADFPEPALWRYAGVAEQNDDGNLTVVFDGGPQIMPVMILVEPNARFRRVMDDQEPLHDTWDLV
jgi:hypothetical protein